MTRLPLRKRLEEERHRLHHAVEDAADLHDPDVVRQSRRVDRLVHELMAAMLETAAAAEQPADHSGESRDR